MLTITMDWNENFVLVLYISRNRLGLDGEKDMGRRCKCRCRCKSVFVPVGCRDEKKLFSILNLS